MKIYVYYNEALSPSEGYVSCELYPDGDHTGQLIQEIEAEETTLPITEVWKGEDIAVGEVFACNDVVPNLIRTA